MSPVLAATDLLGLHARYYRADRAGTADSIRALLNLAPRPRAELDRQGVRGYLGGQPPGRRTCFRAVRRLPAGCQLLELDGHIAFRTVAWPPWSGQSPSAALSAAVEKILAGPGRKAIALSGGLDSAVTLALIRRASGHELPVFTLASAMPGYCELEQTRKVAGALGVSELQIVHAGPRDFIEALPDAVAAAEVPLYNLHPVSKLLLARALAARGIDVVVTGDAADQVFGTTDGRNYLPIVGALFRAAGVELRTPFGDPRVIAAASAAGRDGEKSALRALSRGLVPAWCIEQPKRPRYTPPMDLSRYVRPGVIAALAADIGVPRPVPAKSGSRAHSTSRGPGTIAVDRVARRSDRLDMPCPRSLPAGASGGPRSFRGLETTSRDRERTLWITLALLVDAVTGGGS